MEKGMTIKVRLLPRSSREEVVGKEGELYRIKVTAPPVDGKANAALVKLLAKKLRVPKKNIAILSGDTSRVKTIRIDNLPPDRIESLLLEPS